MLSWFSDVAAVLPQKGHVDSHCKDIHGGPRDLIYDYIKCEYSYHLDRNWTVLNVLSTRYSICRSSKNIKMSTHELLTGREYSFPCMTFQDVDWKLQTG